MGIEQFYEKTSLSQIKCPAIKVAYQNLDVLRETINPLYYFSDEDIRPVWLDKTGTIIATKNSEYDPNSVMPTYIDAYSTAFKGVYIKNELYEAGGYFVQVEKDGFYKWTYFCKEEFEERFLEDKWNGVQYLQTDIKTKANELTQHLTSPEANDYPEDEYEQIKKVIDTLLTLNNEINKYVAIKKKQSDPEHAAYIEHFNILLNRPSDSLNNLYEAQAKIESKRAENEGSEDKADLKMFLDSLNKAYKSGDQEYFDILMETEYSNMEKRYKVLIVLDNDYDKYIAIADDDNANVVIGVEEDEDNTESNE